MELSGKLDTESVPSPGHGHAKLSFLAAVIFIVGEVAGSGVLALPAAMKNAGWAGVAICTFCCLATGRAGMYLGKSWCIVEERWPEYQVAQTDPYSVIGLRAFGRKAQIAASFSVFMQCYGSAVVVLSICAELIYSLVKDIKSIPLTSCEWIIVIGLIAIPFMWLPTPAEITFVAYTAMGCTAVSVLLMLIIFGQEFTSETHVAIPPSPVIPKSFFLSIATMSFAFGGAAAFPTFQNFMKDKTKFPRAVMSGYICLLVIFIPIAVGGFALYGGSTLPNILNNLPDSALKTSIRVLMAFHVFAALLILINPVNMSFEKTLGMDGASGGFGLKRVLVRSWIGLSLIGVILSVPKFEKILGIVGATSVSTTSFIFPTLFYWGLTRQVDESWPDRRLGIKDKILCLLIGSFGVIGGSIATYFGAYDIFSPDAFTKPCYVP